MRRIENPEVRKEKIDSIKATLKSLIFPSILALIIFVGVWVVINYQNKETSDSVVPAKLYEGTEEAIVLENDELKLTMDPKTTQFEVLVKDSGVVWKSNPDNAANDSGALESEKGKLQSLLYLSYGTQTGGATLYDSYSYSVANSIYEIEYDADHIRLNFSLGKVRKTYPIPTVITETNYLKWTGMMEKADSSLVSNYYKKYDINNLSKKDNKEELLEAYPILETDVIYVLRDSTKDGMKKAIQQRLEAVGYTYEDYLADKELDNSQASSDSKVFNVSLELRLEGDELIATVPFDSIEYPESYPVYTLSVLPYFGAGAKDEDGYLFVPEGGGATINFNNGKTLQNTYLANVYGWDYCVKRDSLVHDTRAYFAVYGISKGNSSFICMLEDGSTYAAIQADIGGKVSSYNYVNALYTISNREKYDVGEIANSDVYKYFSEDPNEKIVLRYSFIDSGSYVDMAKDYREYIQKNYNGYFTLNDDSSTPIAIEAVGAVDKVKQIVGIPVSRPLELTSVNELEEMIKTLTSEGVSNMSVKYTGWCNGGVDQKVLTNVKLVSDLGSTKDLKQMTATAESLGVDVYLDGITQYAKGSSNIFNGFFSYSDAAKLISKDKAILYQYSHITYAERENTDRFYLLHASNAAECTNNLVNYVSKYGLGVSFQDAGMDLSSDFYLKNPTTREKAKANQEEEFKQLADNGQNVMINMGNDYAMPYVDMITNMDLRGSQYTILDDYIPFYQIAVHGYVNYVGEALNVCGNDVDELLASAEYGAGLYFCLMDESSFTLQKTVYTQYYGAEFDQWHQRMLDIYTRYNNELGHVFNQEIIDHKKITNDISITTYADGTRVYVNYTYEDTVVDGVTVSARDYKVVK